MELCGAEAHEAMGDESCFVTDRQTRSAGHARRSQVHRAEWRTDSPAGALTKTQDGEGVVGGTEKYT